MSILGKLVALLAKDAATAIAEVKESGGLPEHIVKFNWPDFECSYEDKKLFHQAMTLHDDKKVSEARQVVEAIQDTRLRTLVDAALRAEPPSPQKAHISRFSNFGEVVDRIVQEHSDCWLSSEEALQRLQELQSNLGVHLDQPDELMITGHGITRRPTTIASYQRNAVAVCSTATQAVRSSSQPFVRDPRCRVLRDQVRAFCDGIDHTDPSATLAEMARLSHDVAQLTGIQPGATAAHLPKRNIKAYSHMASRLDLVPDRIIASIHKALISGTITIHEAKGHLHKLTQAAADPKYGLAQWNVDRIHSQCKDAAARWASQYP